MQFFRKLQQAKVVEAPFPHLVMDEAIDPELCRTLLREMPPLPVLTRGAAPESNKRFTLNSHEVLSHPTISTTWKELVPEGLSQALFETVRGLFAAHIRREFPAFVKSHGPPEALRIANRLTGKLARDHVGLDSQLAVNTPALTAGASVRGPHLDKTDKLFVGLLYLRTDADDSQGGDLELYESAVAVPTFGPKRMLPRSAVKLVRTVPYRCNTLVLFLNTPRSLHGVSERSQTAHPRYFLNLVGEMAAPLYHVVCREAAA